ncbi:RNA ligase family protein [Providencia burhodogranariea]
MNMQSRKYGRTYHYPFSPGTTSDDRINSDWWSHMQNIEQLVHTEKLDGENNCLSQQGVFARSHATPTQSAWSQQIRQRWQLIKNDLGDIELFGENLYAVHSIEYQHIEDYFYIFAVRQGDYWLSWEEVKFYAALFDFPTVPELSIVIDRQLGSTHFSEQLIAAASSDSQFIGHDTQTHQSCCMEGIVTRDSKRFLVDDFMAHVFKYVRKNHVKTDIHWKRNWQRAKLAFEHQGGTQ